MSANFTQVSGPGGRVQSFTPGAATQTFIWNPSSLKGQLDGGDWIYAKRIRVKTTGVLTNGTGGNASTPNWEQIAQCFGQVRVYSPFLGEVVPKSLTSVPLLANHDSFFDNGYGANTRRRSTSTVSNAGTTQIEYEFEIPFEREFLERSTDSLPWLPFLEGGIIEVDLAPSTALSGMGWTMSGTWTQTVTIDWYVDKQALIHCPMQSRLYRVTTTGPEYLLKSVGSPNGLDGVMAGSRLAVLSWLMSGATQGAPGPFHDSGFYAAFGGGGLTGLGTNGLTRLDIPFRNQVSIDDVGAWVSSFLSDSRATRFKANFNAGAPDTADNDLAGWPFTMDGRNTLATQSLIADGLNFFPLIWPCRDERIADMQKVNGDLSFTATLTTPPGSNILHLFRSEEICGFTDAKVMDLMDRMGLSHVSRGGSYDFVPKYAGAKRADPTTVWGFPLKIVAARK